MKKSIFTLSAIFLFITAAVAGGYEVGSKVKSFTLKNIDGEMVNFDSYPDAKGFIVVFTCNECPYAVAYEDRVNELNKKYADLGYPVIAINPNDAEKVPGDSYEMMKVRAKEKGITYAYVHDENQDIAKQFGATRTPHVYVVERKAKDMVVQYIGAIDNNTRDAEAADEKYVESAVDALIGGSEVPTKSTKAIGCTIKWAS
ncbi:MAG: peroxiredoxin [Sphingobacteriales bacterium]|jgi:peroxiredoxin